MQNIDFSKMTDEELIVLTKQIRKVRQIRKTLTKEDLSRQHGFYRAFTGRDVSDDAVSDDAFDRTHWTISEQLHMNILAICDYILGNYEVRETRTRRGAKKVVMKRNGKYIEERVDDYKELYGLLADTITAAICNYQDKKGEK